MTGIEKVVVSQIGMNELKSHIIDVMPIGVIVYKETMRIAFRNKKAELFLRRHDLPGEVPMIARRMFSAIKNSQFDQVFPGEVYLYKRLQGSQSRWVFRLDMNKSDPPEVTVFISEEPVSETVDLLKARRRFKFTRRETDVIRRLLRGLKNGDIATDMNIREQTVKDYLSNIYEKTGVGSRIALARVLMNFKSSDE